MYESVEPFSYHNLFFGPLFDLILEFGDSPVVFLEVMAGLGGFAFGVGLQFFEEFLA